MQVALKLTIHDFHLIIRLWLIFQRHFELNALVREKLLPKELIKIGSQLFAVAMQTLYVIKEHLLRHDDFVVLHPLHASSWRNDS